MPKRSVIISDMNLSNLSQVIGKLAHEKNVLAFFTTFLNCQFRFDAVNVVLTHRSLLLHESPAGADDSGHWRSIPLANVERIVVTDHGSLGSLAIVGRDTSVRVYKFTASYLPDARLFAREFEQVKRSGGA